MGWTTVETPNAVYKVVFEMHSRKSWAPLEELDGIILELNAPPGYLLKHPDAKKIYGGIFDHCSKRKTPIFLGDINTFEPANKIFEEDSDRIQNTKRAGLLFLNYRVFLAELLAPFLLVPGKELALRKPLVPLINAGGRIILSKMIKARDAIISEKAEEVVAPLLQKRLGRKPVIGIVHGAGHAGIVHWLKRPRARKRALEPLTRELSPKTYLNVSEVFRQKGKWRIQGVGKITIPKRVEKKPIKVRARLVRRKMNRVRRLFRN